MLNMSTLNNINNTDNNNVSKNISDIYTNFNIHKSKPIAITMKKSLSLENFWPNTPPSNSPNTSFLHSVQNFLNKKIKHHMK
jgi:hypothetical protein